MNQGYDPFFTEETAAAMSLMGQELEKSYRGVADEVTAFVNRFRMSDTPFLVASMESFVTAMKENFDKHDQMLYALVTITGSRVVVSRMAPRRDSNEES